MFDIRQSNLQDVTSYAPGRIALLGMVKAIFGLLVTGMGVVAIYATAGGDMKPTHPGDMPQWWMILVGAGLAIFGLVVASGGVGRMLSALADGCYFKAGPEGLAVRLPKEGWLGRFRLVEYHFRWEEIEDLIYFTRSTHLIPVARELHIRLNSGNEVTIQRFYFAASIKSIREELMKIRTQAGK